MLVCLHSLDFHHYPSSQPLHSRLAAPFSTSPQQLHIGKTVCHIPNLTAISCWNQGHVYSPSVLFLSGCKLSYASKILEVPESVPEPNLTLKSLTTACLTLVAGGAHSTPEKL